MVKTLVPLRLLSLILICGMEVCVFAQTPTPNIPKLDILLTQKDYKTVPENFEAVCRSAAMGWHGIFRAEVQADPYRKS